MGKAAKEELSPCTLRLLRRLLRLLLLMGMPVAEEEGEPEAGEEVVPAPVRAL